ncbi:MAG TPA: Gfo/Idh/MocA family oxidoreductase [Jatrophihabitantaceae bacterium]|jgi:predicted dehydrogenase
MADSIRWGILGAGGIAATVGPEIAAAEGNDVAAVGARDLDRAAALADRVGAPRSYGSYAELAADPDVDVVYIATTHGQHHEHALLCLQAGKPILVEKAFTLNARQAREVIAEARARQLFCMEGMWMRLNPLIIKAQEIAASGRIGDVISVHADLSHLFPYDPNHRLYDLAAGGGSLLDLGVYPATFAWLFLGRPDVVQTVGALAPTGADASAAMQWGYADGRFAQVSCSAQGTNPLTGLVAGTAGWISIGQRVHRAPYITVHDDAGDEEFRQTITATGFDHEINEVARCLRAGELESPRAPLDETLAILEVLDQARAQLGVRYAADAS